ncbi:hypothetical protein MHYP_G00164940 [Metynnis hypsauchen]
MRYDRKPTGTSPLLMVALHKLMSKHCDSESEENSGSSHAPYCEGRKVRAQGFGEHLTSVSSSRERCILNSHARQTCWPNTEQSAVSKMFSFLTSPG